MFTYVKQYWLRRNLSQSSFDFLESAVKRVT